MRVSAVAPQNIYTGPEDVNRAKLGQAGESKLDNLPDNLKPEHLKADKTTVHKPHLAHAPSHGKDDAGIPKWLEDDEGAVYDGTRPCGCEKCARRLYQDGSADAGVSFKGPTRIDPKMSRSVVAAHEREHVRRDSYKVSQLDGVKVAKANVRLFQRSCSECGVIYCSGGVTTITLGMDVPMYKLMGHDIDAKA